ncbi:MAG: hypothetical protein IPM13_01905 [Phycisphaerales bacterium]|nr:hypothetical protein [Phycisphaerales bacterium]
MMLGGSLVLGWLMLHPITLPDSWRLWMLLPLVACVALVYRATRARQASELPWPTVKTFFQILAGMVLIALGFWVAHWAAIRFL